MRPTESSPNWDYLTDEVYDLACEKARGIAGSYSLPWEEVLHEGLLKFAAHEIRQAKANGETYKIIRHLRECMIDYARVAAVKQSREIPNGLDARGDQ